MLESRPVVGSSRNSTYSQTDKNADDKTGRVIN